MGHNASSTFPSWLPRYVLVTLAAAGSAIAVNGLSSTVGAGSAVLIGVVVAHYLIYSFAYFFRKGWNKADVV
jgi:hypothetical protein